MTDSICSVCGVVKCGKVFLTSIDRKNGTVSDADKIYTRVCRHAKKSGCINVDGSPDLSKNYFNFGLKTNDYLEMAREVFSSQHL